MKAIALSQPGGPENLQLQDLPQPEITAGQVLVKLKAAGINPIDTKLRSRGTFYPDTTPQVLGCDGAGIIEAIGSEVTGWQPGQAVYFCYGGLGGPAGNYAEWAAVDARCLAPKPDRLSFAEAAAAPLVLITAWEALRDRARITAGQKVLIHAGAGGVGHVAIQLAKLWGAEVAATVSTPEKADFVAGLGCDRPILYRQEDFVSALQGWTGGQGVDIAFDTVGGELLTATFPAVRPYGDVVTILEPAANTNWKVARNHNLRIGLELMLTPLLKHWDAGLRHQAEILRQCAAWIDAGQLKIQLHQTFPLDRAAEAHQLLERGGLIGKLALAIDP